MSDSGDPKTYAQVSHQESNYQQGEVTKNLRKRSLDGYSKNEISRLETLTKVSKPTSRKLEFGRTEDDALPLACSICREPFLNPVVTRCNNYFCENCALKHHEKNNKCFVCNNPTQGVFDKAVEINQKIAQVREKAKAMVKEVSDTVKKAVVTVQNAEAMAAVSAEMVKEVETVMRIVETYGANSVDDDSSWDSVVRLVENVENVAASARDMAEKVAEMVQEANAMTETARAEMAKAVVVMKKVKWNVL